MPTFILCSSNNFWIYTILDSTVLQQSDGNVAIIVNFDIHFNTQNIAEILCAQMAIGFE